MVAAASCTHAEPLRTADQVAIVVASGDRQSAPAGTTAASDLVARVTHGSAGIGGVRVTFRVVRGAGDGSFVDDAAAISDADGLVRTRLTLGAQSDTTVVRAELATVDGPAADFVAVTSGALTVTSVVPSTFASGDTVTVNGSGFVAASGWVGIGDAEAPVLAGGSAARLRFVAPPCLPAGPIGVRLHLAGGVTPDVNVSIRAPRSAIALGPFESMTVNASRLGACAAITAEPNATYLVTAQFASAGSAARAFDWRLDAGGGVATAVRAVPEVAAGGLAQREWEASLRALEARLAPAAARGSSAASLRAPPAVGSLRTFSVIASTDGTRFEPATGRLAYAGDHVFVYVDTASHELLPANVTSLARLMDRELYPTTVKTFGSEPDVDGDGHVIVLLTPVVNRMSKASECVQRGFVTGFFYGLDVVERDSRSNRAEVFYAFVPDSAGRQSCAHAEADVIRILQPTFAHELQHLISFNQHVLVRGDFPEETWLNEGLSHMAEEAASKVFEARYPAPLGRSTTTQLFPDSAGPFIAPQLLNAYIYLNSATQHSVTTYVGAGSIEERGATWLFLRWLADHAGDGVLRRLVETSAMGTANVERVAGEPFAGLFADFSQSLITDSIPGLRRDAVPPRQRFLTRNLRQLMAREATISGFQNPFPLSTYLLDAGGALRSSMFPGTMVHAAVRADSRGTPIRLSFTTPQFIPFGATLGAQVSVMRMP